MPMFHVFSPASKPCFLPQCLCIVFFFGLRVYQLKKHVPECNKHRFVGVPWNFVQAFLLQICFFDAGKRMKQQIPRNGVL